MTMRWAVISDVHGNVRALDAVLADVCERNVEAVVNLGDCAYGPFDPHPVMDRLVPLNYPTVKGNEDRLLVDAARGDRSSRTAAFCARHMERHHVEWLAALPLSRTIGNVVLLHGTPTDDAQSLLTAVEPGGARPRTSEEIGALLEDVRTPLVLCGHDHTPRKDRTRLGTVVVNPGSVGCPAYMDDEPYEHVIENGSPHARYAVVTFDAAFVDVDWVVVAYDWDKAAAEAAANGFPDWARWLSTGRA